MKTRTRMTQTADARKTPNRRTGLQGAVNPYISCLVEKSGTVAERLTQNGSPLYFHFIKCFIIIFPVRYRLDVLVVVVDPGGLSPNVQNYKKVKDRKIEK